MNFPIPNLSIPGASSFASPELEWLVPYLMLWAAITIPAVVAGWLGVFTKAGQPRWAALIPVYNIYVLVVRVARLSPLWFVLIMIPPVNLIASILVNVEVAKRFGRSEAFGVGMSVFGFVLYPIIGFNRDGYESVHDRPRTNHHRPR